MKPTLCSRCKKNLAVIFITKVENGKTTNEGLCLKCAKEMGIKQVDEIVERMGITCIYAGDREKRKIRGDFGIS